MCYYSSRAVNMEKKRWLLILWWERKIRVRDFSKEWGLKGCWGEGLECNAEDGVTVLLRQWQWPWRWRRWWAVCICRCSNAEGGEKVKRGIEGNPIVSVFSLSYHLICLKSCDLFTCPCTVDGDWWGDEQKIKTSFDCICSNFCFFIYFIFSLLIKYSLFSIYLPNTYSQYKHIYFNI